MRAVRILLGLVVFLAILMVAAYAFRLPIAGAAVRSAMGDAGLEAPRANVAALSLSSIRLENVSAGQAGSESFRFEAIEADFNWRTLWSDREVRELRIGPGEVRAVLSPDGELSIAGFPLGGNGGDGPRKLPFSKLAIDGVSFFATTPQGDVQGSLSAEYDLDAGGAASAELNTKLAGYDAFRVEDGALAFDAVFNRNGDFDIEGSLKGKMISSTAELQETDVAFTVNGASWRDIAEGRRDQVQLSAIVNVLAMEFPVEAMAFFDTLNNPRIAALLGGPVTTLSASGKLKIDVDAGALDVGISDRTESLRAETDTGIGMTLSSTGGRPFYARSADEERLSIVYALSGARIDAQGELLGEKTDGNWRLHAPATFREFQSDSLAFKDTSLEIQGLVTGADVEADVSIVSLVQKASIGRLNVFDAPVAVKAKLVLNNDEKNAQLFLPDECLKVVSARMTIERQDTEATFRNAELCESSGPVAVLDWSDEVIVHAKGYAYARNARYRLGKTRVEGSTPSFIFKADYRPIEHTTFVTGTINGGSMTVRDALVFSKAQGTYDFRLDPEMMRATLNVASVEVVENRDPIRIAPVIATGEGNLVRKSGTFDYVLRTPSGARLGAGKGIHNFDNASGKSHFLFDRIELKPGGLQPDRLAPVLKGIIGSTVGGATGVADFSWSQSELITTAELTLENISFGGPTRIVTRTTGLNGTIRFSDLWPSTSDGAQTITVEGVDLDALQLTKGEITFDLPGDETLHVSSAIFPWFGGELGVYNATAAYGGGEAVVPLRVEKIDLGQILEYVDIEGLSGEGILSGVLPLVVEEGRARIENGVMKSEGPGAIRYQGQAAERAASAGPQAKTAFDLLRDLRYETLGVTVNGPLDGRLEFQLKFEGTGEVALNQQNVRVPVIYRINLDAALLELLRQANLSKDFQLQIRRGLTGEDEAE